MRAVDKWLKQEKKNIVKAIDDEYKYAKGYFFGKAPVSDMFSKNFNEPRGHVSVKGILEKKYGASKTRIQIIDTDEPLEWDASKMVK
jgi:hypothetical protein